MRLIDCFIPFLAAVRQLQRAGDGELAEVDARLNLLLADARRHALAGGTRAAASAADFDAALFAVLAWADEAIIGSAWPGAAGWQRHLLQKRYFNVSNAGLAFFTRLENLTAIQSQVREVYLMCLGIGFVGRYGYEGQQAALADIRQIHLAQLQQGVQAQDAMLFPDGYGMHLPSPPKPRLKLGAFWARGGWSLSVLALLALAALYGIYHCIIWQFVTGILQ